MANSFQLYNGDNATANFSFTFDYISRDHITAFISGVATGFNWINATTIQLLSLPPVGVDNVRIQRTTPSTAQLVTFQDGSVETAANLNNSAKQFLFLSQEALDSEASAMQQDTFGRWDAEGSRVINVANGVDAQDAATMAQLALAAVSPVGTLAVANGGTGGTDAATARTNLAVVGTGTYAGKGGILVATSAPGAPALRTVGSNGTVILANSFQASGIAYAAVLNKVIHGLTYSNNVTDAAHDLDIAAGGAMDETGALWMAGGAMTKQSDAVFAVGTNQGAVDLVGSIGNNEFYIWEIARSATGVVDYLFSLSSTAPTMPTSGGTFDHKRLIGWFKKVAGSIVAFKTYETEGGGIEHLWVAPTLDIDVAAGVTNAQRLDSPKVPQNFSVEALLNVGWYDASATGRGWVYCPDQTSAEPSYTAAPLGNIISSVGTDAQTGMRIRTSAAGKIAARTNAAVGTLDVYRVSTLGFRWSRR